MMTLSQKCLREADELSRAIERLYAEMAPIQATIEEYEMEHDKLRKMYTQAYKEERESRRNYVPEVRNHMTAPHPIPSAQWQVWRNIIDRVSEVWHKQTTHKYHFLLANLSRFAQDMMGLTNFQGWNERNPNPHLP